MDRYITITDTITGQQATCSTFDISDTIGPWYPEADEITTEAIAAFADTISSERYPDADAGAVLALTWEWATPLGLREAADHL